MTSGLPCGANGLLRRSCVIVAIEEADGESPASPRVMEVVGALKTGAILDRLEDVLAVGHVEVLEVANTCDQRQFLSWLDSNRAYADSAAPCRRRMDRTTAWFKYRPVTPTETSLFEPHHFVSLGGVGDQWRHVLCTHVQYGRTAGHSDDVSAALSLARRHCAPDTARCSDYHDNRSNAITLLGCDGLPSHRGHRMDP